MIIPEGQHFQERTYDLHNIFRLHVRSPHMKVMRHFEDELGHFSDDGISAPDLEVIVDRFQIDLAAQMRLAGRNYVLEDGFGGEDRHKVAIWRFAIQGLQEQPTRLYFTGGPFSLGFLQHRYVEPLMRYKLSKRGYMMVHGCCVVHDGSAVLLPGLMHTGKTNIALHLVLRNWQFQSDDYTIVGADSQTFSYPRRMHFSSHVMENYPEALGALSLRHRLSMAIKKAIYISTLRYGNLTEAVSIDEIVPAVEIADTARLETLILLTTYVGEQLKGPLPVSPSEAADRVLAINRREGSQFENIMLEYEGMHANISLKRRLDRERQIVESALQHTACYELLIPQRAEELESLLTQIGDLVEQTTGLSPNRSLIARDLGSVQRYTDWHASSLS